MEKGIKGRLSRQRQSRTSASTCTAAFCITLQNLFFALHAHLTKMVKIAVLVSALLTTMASAAAIAPAPTAAPLPISSNSTNSAADVFGSGKRALQFYFILVFQASRHSITATYYSPSVGLFVFNFAIGCSFVHLLTSVLLISSGACGWQNVSLPSISISLII